MHKRNAASAAKRSAEPIARSVALRREVTLSARALQRQVRQIRELAWSMRRHAAASRVEPSEQAPLSDDEG